MKKTVLLAVAILALFACRKKGDDVELPTGVQTVPGFPLPVPAGSTVLDMRNVTTRAKPRHNSDAELEARVPGDADVIVSFYKRLLEARKMNVVVTDHSRVDPKRPGAKQEQLIRVVATKDKSRFQAIITRGVKTHRLQISVVGL